jgi:ABC-type bacteriocin/lantibiotic exporter with double-glycine peptidase domain
MRGVEMVWEALIPIASAALLFYGWWRVLDGHTTVGDLMMFHVYLVILLEPLATLVQSATQFQNSLSGRTSPSVIPGPTRPPSKTSNLTVSAGQITCSGV